MSLVTMEETSAVKSEEKEIRQPGPMPAPWLVFPQGECKKEQILYNLAHANTVHYRKMAEMRSNLYWQSPSHQGWLIIKNQLISDDDKANDEEDSSTESRGGFFLWNPVSLEKIKLPSLDIIDCDQIYIKDCVLSSPPTNPYGSMVFILLQRDDSGIISPDHLLFCRPGRKQWGTLELSEEKDSPAKLVCFKGSVYYMYTYNGRIMIKELVADGQSLSLSEGETFETPPSAPLTGAGLDVQSYYVESLDELFIVEKYFYSNKLVTLQILRMNFSTNTVDEVKSLGHRVLFLGHNTTASCSTKDLGYASGCLYFTQAGHKGLYTFDPEDGSISVTLPCPNLAMGLSPNWVMMMPITARVDDGRTEHLLKRRRLEDAILEGEINKISVNDDGQGQKTKERKLQEAGIWDIPYAECKICRGELKLAGTWDSLKAVCTTCITTIPAVKLKTTSIEITPTTYFSPWFVFLRKDDAIYNFIDPVHNLKYIVDLSDLLLEAKIYYSKGGWLLMSDCVVTFFFNPFTRAMIKLPILQDGWKFMFYGMSFSSLPTSSDCKVFGIAECSNSNRCEDKIHMFGIARGDHFWKEYILEGTNYPWEEGFRTFKPLLNNPVFCDAKALYFLDSNGVLGVFDLEENIKWESIAMPEKLCSSFAGSFLVECEGKILSVFLGDVGELIQIFTLDITRRVWTEVKSLGNRMLFLSRSTCITKVAPNSSMENKIYLPRFHAEHMVYYSLDTGSYHSLGGRHSAPDLYNTKEQIHCTWIEPNWSEATDKELHWLQC